MDSETPVVLVVDDERDLADMYAAWLLAEYRVRTAYGGDQALEVIDETVDVVLLDRDMPDRSGDEVLAAVRERGLDCRVALVTGIEPGFDILEMGFDDYLTKPVGRDDLREAVECLRRRADYDATIREYYRLAVKRAKLESRTEPGVRQDPRYRALLTEIRDVEEELRSITTDFEPDDFDAQFLRPERRPNNE